MYLSTMPSDPNVKMIYMCREPRDVCNSFYHHLSHQAPEDGGYTEGRGEFVREWSDGKIAFGAWGNHLRSWLKDDGRVRKENCIRVDYAEMKVNLESVVRKVAGHLGMVEMTEEEVNDILPRLGIKYMKVRGGWSEARGRLPPVFTESLTLRSFCRITLINSSPRASNGWIRGTVFRSLGRARSEGGRRSSERRTKLFLRKGSKSFHLRQGAWG